LFSVSLFFPPHQNLIILYDVSEYSHRYLFIVSLFGTISNKNLKFSLFFIFLYFSLLITEHWGAAVITSAHIRSALFQDLIPSVLDSPDCFDKFSHDRFLLSLVYLLFSLDL